MAPRVPAAFGVCNGGQDQEKDRKECDKASHGGPFDEFVFTNKNRTSTDADYAVAPDSTWLIWASIL